MTVVIRTLRDQRRGLVVWGIGVAATVGLMMAMWPSISGMPDLEAFIDNYPEVFRELFALGDFGTPTGFLNAELFSFMIPLLFMVFAMGRGARLVAGEEEDRVLEVLLALPAPRWRILLGKAVALALSVSVLGLILLITMVACSLATGMDLGTADIAAVSVAMILLGIQYGWLAMAVGAATGSRALAIGVASVAAVAAYVLLAMSRLVEALDGWEVVSPIQHALREGPLGTGWAAGSLAAMATGAVLVMAAALPVFSRRDVRG